MRALRAPRDPPRRLRYRQCDGLHAGATYDRAAHIAEGGSLDGVIDRVGAAEALSEELRADLGFAVDDEDDLGGPFVAWDLGMRTGDLAIPTHFVRGEGDDRYLWALGLILGTGF